MDLKKTHLIAAAIILGVEVCIALWVRDFFVRPYVGDFLATIFVYCVLRGIFAGSAIVWATSAVGISFLVETLQAFRIVERLGLADCPVAVVLIGTSFSFGDLVAYLLGGVVALVLDVTMSATFSLGKH